MQLRKMPRVILESIARPYYFTFMSPRYIYAVAIECDANYCFQNLTNSVYSATGLNMFCIFLFFTRVDISICKVFVH